jgi:hypothetical protein
MELIFTRDTSGIGDKYGARNGAANDKAVTININTVLIIANLL